MQVFFQNYKRGIGVSTLNPLDAMMEQVLDIFDTLPEDDGSFLGVVNEANIRIQISKYDRYNWLVDIPMLSRRGTYQMFLSRDKCKQFIKKLYNGLDPLKMHGLSFEKFV